MMETFHFIEKSDFNNTFKLLFVLVYFRSILKGVGKVGVMLQKSRSILLLVFITLFFFSVIARVIFENVEIGQDGMIYGYSFINIWRSLDSMFLLMLMENFPDILLEAYGISTLYFIFFFIYIIFASIIVLSLVVGVFYFHFKNFYVYNLNKVVGKYDNFES